eukprot:g574.t1
MNGFTSQNLRGARVGAELGVQRGAFAEELLSRWTNCQVYVLVDTWARPRGHYADVANVDDATHESFLQETLRRLKPLAEKHGTRLEICRNLTTACADRFADGSFDFIYVDARHDYKGVSSDLEKWWPKIRRGPRPAAGGIMAGHDYVTQREVAGQDWTLNEDGTRDWTGRVVKGAVDDFFSTLFAARRRESEEKRKKNEDEEEEERDDGGDGGHAQGDEWRYWSPEAVHVIPDGHWKSWLVDAADAAGSSGGGSTGSGGGGGGDHTGPPRFPPVEFWMPCPRRSPEHRSVRRPAGAAEVPVKLTFVNELFEVVQLVWVQEGGAEAETLMAYLGAETRMETSSFVNHAWRVLDMTGDLLLEFMPDQRGAVEPGQAFTVRIGPCFRGDALNAVASGGGGDGGTAAAKAIMDKALFVIPTGASTGDEWHTKVLVDSWLAMRAADGRGGGGAKVRMRGEEEEGPRVLLR